MGQASHDKKAIWVQSHFLPSQGNYPEMFRHFPSDHRKISTAQ